MPMTTKAAQLHSMHKQKAERLWQAHIHRGPFISHHVANLAGKHDAAAHAIYNCPESWESEDTMTKLQEISAYLGLPLYKEWLEARGDTDFAEYVDHEYSKMKYGKIGEPLTQQQIDNLRADANKIMTAPERPAR